MYDIAIIGAGPVGSAGAILLAHAGLSVALIEREREVYRLPRAVNLDGEIIRAFQPLGLAEELDAMMQKVRPGEKAGFTNSRREWLFGSASPPLGGNGWQPSNMFDQPEVETWLRECALGHDKVTGYIGRAASAFSDIGDVVELKLEDGETLQCRYLIGCDGAGSQVRKAIGSSWQSLGYDRDWLVVDVTMTREHELPNAVLQVCDPDRIQTYVATKDPWRRWEFRLNPGESPEQMLVESQIHELLEPWTPRDTYEIRRAAVYQFHAATADCWRKRNVFIAGDAAHQTPPFLGQGMNSGIRDVINLAWKLPLVCKGVANASLLDTYQAEREAHARDLVDWAVAIGQLMEYTADTEAAVREGKPVPPPPKSIQSSGYGQGREQPPIREGVVVTSQLSDKGASGYLLRQPRVSWKGGEPVRLDTLLGPGFAIVGRNRESLQLSKDSCALVEKLGATMVAIDELVVVDGSMDPVFEYAEAAIIRPDRLVFGHTDTGHALDRLLEELASLLCLE